MTGITSDDSRPAGMARELRPEDPRKLGPYWLLGRLGGGGMGEVFLGRSPGGRLIAVKVVRSELAGQAEFRQRFAREVAAAQKVSGLFTVPVVDADVDAPVPWLATAYVPGPSLADAITGHGPLPVTPVLALAAGLAEGLGAIHAAGIVHRDLKPSNVLLADDGPRIIDFGISRAAEATVLTGTGVIFGSAAFMSPEQARGHLVGPPSDVFSLGAVLTFAATGQGPFGTGSSDTLLYRVVFTPPDTSGLPAELRPLVDRCLAKDPEQRPSANQLLAELDTAPPAAGWLPAPITQAFLSHLPAEPGPAAPTAAGDLPAQAMTQSAAPRSAAPDGKMPTVPPGDMPPPAAAGTEAPGDSRGGRRPGRLRLGLAGAATAAGLIIIYLVVAMTSHLPPFAEDTLAPSSPASATVAPVSTGPRPSSAAVSPAAVSPVTLPATYPVSLPATSPVTPAATSPVTPAPTSPVTPAPTSPVTPAPTSPVTPAPTSPVTPTNTSPVTPTDTSPVTPTDTSPTG